MQSKQFNVTAQVYKKADPYKQTILYNDVINANTEKEAQLAFEGTCGLIYNIVKVYSIEEINDG